MEDYEDDHMSSSYQKKQSSADISSPPYLSVSNTLPHKPSPRMYYVFSGISKESLKISWKSPDMSTLDEDDHMSSSYQKKQSSASSKITPIKQSTSRRVAGGSSMEVWPE